jgi:hypothetical protein
MNRVLLIALLLGVGTTASSGTEQSAFAPGADRAAATPVPVVVELFTSEGCSSCPPADAVLSRLRLEQPVHGAQIIALGEHVDYWNYLGWKDRFSSAVFSTRQARYRDTAFSRGVVYTPQIVVDGAAEAIGSDPAAVRRAIERAARRDKLAVRLRVARADPRELTVTVAVESAADRATDVVLVTVEDGLTTDVARGENRGRTLSHDAVVRSMKTVARLEPGESPPQLERSLPIDASWDLTRLRVIALVQDARSLAILGAAEAPLAAP